MDFSVFLPIVIVAAGIFLLFRLRFFFILHPIKCFGAFLSELRSENSRSALCLALAGTLGVGNIFGTAAGLMIGGAGSVFWLLVSAVFSMVLKYSETTLALDMKDGEHGGMHYIILRVFKNRGKFLAAFYAALCLALALFMGAAIQSSAVCDAAKISLGLPQPLSSLVLALLLLVAVSGGAEKIERISTRLVPAATLVYLLMSLAALFSSADRIPAALSLVFEEALSPAAFSGGIVSFLTCRALTEGFARGLLSNEAGVGTSAMAHSRSDQREPQVAGLFGISEIFFDTVLLCTLTALVILSAVPDISAYNTPMSLVTAAFESALGALSPYLLTACIFLFGFSTLICWYYYGDECCTFLFKRRGGALYTFAFVFSLIIGSLLGASPLLAVTDAILLFMAVLSLSAVIRSSDRILYLTNKLIY